jgi:deazaflavin-dependent oxidoreductase (nitroreductase family)
MPLPRWLARTNRRFTNHLLGRLPRRWSPFAIVYHSGRTTGKSYRTPLAAFKTETGAILTPTYGPGADWVKNVLVAERFQMDIRGSRWQLHGARLVGRDEAWPYLPLLVRVAMRLLRIDVFVRADLT